MNKENAELEFLDSQARMLVEQLENVDASLMEIEYLRSSIDELKGMKEGSDILAPMSSGIFIKAKLSNSNALLMNVGNSVVVEKSAEDTKKLLDARIVEISEVREKLLLQLQKIDERLKQLGER